jgi:hypothetical protein
MAALESQVRQRFSHIFRRRIDLCHKSCQLDDGRPLNP